MQMIMNDMMKDMASGPVGGGGSTVRISGGMGTPTMTIRRTITSIPHDDDDDDDLEDGIPPEILELMKMTESMFARPSSPFGGMFGSPMIRMGSAKPKEEKIERHDESAADIMARMNKLSEEIGERNTKDKYEFVD